MATTKSYKGMVLPDSCSSGSIYAMVGSASVTVTNIVNADINLSAGIVDTKLSTISTASKVRHTALSTASAANGDILYWDGTGMVRLPIGTAGQKLKSYVSEQVVNGTFSSAATGWTAVNSATLTSVADGLSGNCLKLAVNNLAYPACYQQIAVTATVSYTLVFAFKHSNTSYGIVNVGTTSSGLDIYAGGTLSNTSWATYSTSFTAPASTIYINLNAVIAEATGNYSDYFDEISLKSYVPFLQWA